MVVEIGFSVRAGMATNPGSNPACHACVDCAPELYKLVGCLIFGDSSALLKWNSYEHDTCLQHTGVHSREFGVAPEHTHAYSNLALHRRFFSQLR